MIPLIRTVWNRQVPRGRKEISGCQVLVEEDEGGVTPNGPGVSFQGEEDLRELVMIVIQLCENRWLPSSFLPAAQWQFNPPGTESNSAWGSGKVSNGGNPGGDPQKMRRRSRRQAADRGCKSPDP